jgi:hypothetical protein
VSLKKIEIESCCSVGLESLSRLGILLFYLLISHFSAPQKRNILQDELLFHTIANKCDYYILSLLISMNNMSGIVSIDWKRQVNQTG